MIHHFIWPQDHKWRFNTLTHMKSNISLTGYLLLLKKSGKKKVILGKK